MANSETGKGGFSGALLAGWTRLQTEEREAYTPPGYNTGRKGGIYTTWIYLRVYRDIYTTWVYLRVYMGGIPTRVYHRVYMGGIQGGIPLLVHREAYREVYTTVGT